MPEETTTSEIESPAADAVDAPRKSKRSRKPSALQEQTSPEPVVPAAEADVSTMTPPPATVRQPIIEESSVTADASVPAQTTAPMPTPVPKMVIQQLQQRLMNPDHSVHYQTRQKQLQTTLEIMSQIAKKIGKEDSNQRAVLSGMYELMLVIAERFVLLSHGLMQLDAMNHATALPAIREARRRYKQVADVQCKRQAEEHLDAPSTLQLLSQLSRSSLD